MRITGTPGLPDIAPGGPTGVSSVSPKAATTAAEGVTTAGALQSAVLQPALAAMRDMPEIDEARVQQLREALAKGELPFNASKLAGLIQRFHGSKG